MLFQILLCVILPLHPPLFPPGVITTREPLNREAMSQHELTLMVRDQGTPSRRGLARVTIIVQDHNDHAPDFLAPLVEGRVLETAVVGTSVLQVMAMDRDAGVNAQITYSIVSGEFIWEEICYVDSQLLSRDMLLVCIGCSIVACSPATQAARVPFPVRIHA